MPVDLRVETDGKTENQKMEVVGTDTQYVVDTFGRPRRISIDPDDWVLKIDARPAGADRHPEGPAVGSAGRPCRRVWRSTRRPWTPIPQSSLASYRIGEILFYASATIRPASIPTATRCAATMSRAGPRSGATFRLAKSSTSPGQRDRGSQRVPLGRPDQRQHPGRGQRGQAVSAKALYAPGKRVASNSHETERPALGAGRFSWGSQIAHLLLEIAPAIRLADRPWPVPTWSSPVSGGPIGKVDDPPCSTRSPRSVIRTTTER